MQKSVLPISSTCILAILSMSAIHVNAPIAQVESSLLQFRGKLCDLLVLAFKRTIGHVLARCAACQVESIACCESVQLLWVFLF